jgi:hypothetical protein
LLYGPGIKSNGAVRFSEKEAEKTGILIDNGYKLMDHLVKGKASY